MKMGKYVVRDGLYIHEDADSQPCFLATKAFWFVTVPLAVTLWGAMLLGMGFNPF